MPWETTALPFLKVCQGMQNALAQVQLQPNREGFRRIIGDVSITVRKLLGDLLRLGPPFHVILPPVLLHCIHDFLDLSDGIRLFATCKAYRHLHMSPRNNISLQRCCGIVRQHILADVNEIEGICALSYETFLPYIILMVSG